MAVDKKLKILIVGMSPAMIRKVRLKSIPLAPMLLKAYVDSRIDKEFPGFVDTATRTFFLEETKPAEMASQIIEERPDIVAFSVYIWNYYEAMECARIIRDIDRQIVIICGGPQVSPIAMEVMRQHPYIDAIPYITIPGEVILHHFVRAFIQGKKIETVEGIIHRASNGSLVKTAPLNENLDYSSIPSPYLNNSFSLTPGDSYAIFLETSRGCPYDCGYCFHGCGMKKINYFPLERALKEIEVIYSNPDVKHVNYADSDIFLNHQRTETIVKHILKQKSSAQSQFASNVLRINESLAKLLARLPDYRFCFSVQTTNPKALECIGRLRLNADDVVKKVKEFRRWLPSAEYFIDVMLGLPGDDLRGFKMTLDVCLSLEPTRIALNYPVYLLPGTKFFEEKKALGINYRPTPPFSVIETESFPKHDIERALKLVLWVDILTYFYPAIACFFYSVYVDGMPGTRISRMEKWISAIERNLDIFGFRQNMVDSATGSVQEWNKLKAQVLRRASETESAWQIYYTLQQEEAMHTASMRKTISLGVMIFDYLRSQEMDSVEFSHFDQLPDSIAKSYNLAEIKSVFSRFRR